MNEINLSGEGTFAMTTDSERLAWTQKAIHRKHAHAVTKQYVNSITSSASLIWCGLFLEMECFMGAIQGEVIKTKITENSL